MLYRTYIPPPPLSQFVDKFWFYSGDEPVHRMERVLPDGTTELVINLDEYPRKRFHSADPRRFETFRRAWISGMHPAFILIDVLPRATMMGAHFRPGGLACFVPMPTDQLSGQIVELDALWGRDAFELRDSLLEAQNLQTRFRLLEAYLLRHAQRELRLDPAVAAALRQFLTDPTVSAIKQMAKLAGLSHKHFIARFRAEVGVSPKRFCRIRRFQRAIGEIHARRPVDWTEVAYGGGYYDQAHFIHDFRAFSGLTPARYLAQAGADNRFVPIVE